jgi:hypothetical protein
MTQRSKSSRVDVWTRIRLRRQIAELKRLTDAEGLRLAERVRAGEFTRAEVEAAVRETGDAEPAIALEYLDRWGIR